MTTVAGPATATTRQTPSHTLDVEAKKRSQSP